MKDDSSDTIVTNIHTHTPSPVCGANIFPPFERDMPFKNYKNCGLNDFDYIRQFEETKHNEY